MSLVFEPISTDHGSDPYPVYAAASRECPAARLPRIGDVLPLALRGRGLRPAQPAVLFSSSGMESVLFNDEAKRPGLRDLLAIGRFMLRARVNPIKDRRPPNLITEDPPVHDDMRAIVNRGFTPRRISDLEPRMREIVDRCMQRHCRGEESFDVIRDIAIPLPVTVIAEMLGIEPERQLDFKRWSDAIISASSGGNRGGGLRAILGPLGEMRGYLRHIVRERRERPADDLISVVVDPKHSDTLGDNEVFGFIALLLIAGNETTTNLIGNTTLALLSHPEELAKGAGGPVTGAVHARRDPALGRPGPDVVSLHHRGCRRARAAAFRPAPNVALLLASANRDPDAFEDPDRYDVTRDPRGHLGFGFGVHFCLGASLARLEGRVAMEALVPVLAAATDAPPKPEYVDSFVVRGPRSLPCCRSSA